MPIYNAETGEYDETPEERRKREEEAAGASPGFLSQVGTGIQQGLQKRWENATQAFENPQQALMDRISGATQNIIPQQTTQPVAPQDLANTEVQTQQIKTNGDGSQEHTVKTQIPAPGAQPTAQAQPQAIEIPQVPQPGPGVQVAGPMVMPPPAPTAQPQPVTAVAPTAMAPQAQAQPPAAAPVAPTAMAPQAQPQLAPAGAGAGAEGNLGEAEAQAYKQRTEQNPFQAIAANKAQAAGVPVAAPGPDLHTNINQAVGNVDQLVALASDKTKSPAERKAAVDELQRTFESNKKQESAQEIVLKAAQGDAKAQNELLRSLRPETEKQKASKEVTTSDYVKAYFFKRLGLDSLAQEYQDKITGNNVKYQSMIMDGKPYQVGINPHTGEIISAKDAEGTAQEPGMLSKLGAAATKAGTHAYSQTGEIHNTADNKQVVKVFNAITGTPEWRDIATGEKWQGKGTPTPQSISTAMAKMDYGVITGLQKKHGGNVLDAMDAYQKEVGPMTPEQQQKFLQAYGYGTTVGGAPATAQPTATAPAATTPFPTTTAPAPATTAPAATGGPLPAGMPLPTGAPGAAITPINQLATNRKLAEEAAKAEIQKQKELETVTGKEGAKTVAASQDTQNLISHMDRVVKDIDSGETNFGSRASAVVGRGPVAQWLGSELETKAANNTKMAMDAISKLATEGLKVLGANPSEGDRKFWTENKPNLSSSPEFVKDWIVSHQDDLKRKLNYAQQQVNTGGTAQQAAPVSAVRRYNPATGRLE